ncbi:MAG: glutamyl-tRNA reductase [Anaerolineae bacterium]
MTIVCLGLSYHKTPVEVRECLNFAPDFLDDFLAQFDLSYGRQSIRELVVLSTCNRVELYAEVPDSIMEERQQEYLPFLVEFMARAHNLPREQFEAYLYQHTDMAAARHLFHVAAGLDSMVLGEPQILGQVTEAFEKAQQQHTAGPVLRALFSSAIRVGKRTRTETDIARYPASISSTAVFLAQNIIGEMSQRRALVVGVGKMGKLALKSLGHRRTREISLINRTFARAEKLAKQYHVEAYPMSDLAAEIARADLIFTATGAPENLITAEMVAEAMAQRPQRQLVLVDIAVPRDIDPAVADIPNVHLVDVDALQGQMDETLAKRRQAIPQVKDIIQSETLAFEEKMRKLEVRPLIVDMRRRAEAIRQRELERTRRSMNEVDPASWQKIEILSQSLINKLLHEPTIRLRDEAVNGRSDEYVETMRHLFGLEEPA